ncbi:MAG: DUF2933 domain-containing protein [Streptomyces sp.]|nr:DUF2933 domain-containing protein [Streptomyces sp.]
MNDKHNYGMYAVAAAIVVVGALFVGASPESLVWLALVAVCPLMMFFMMRGMHGQGMHGGHDQRRDDRDGDRSPRSQSGENAPRGHDPTGPGRV